MFNEGNDELITKYKINELIEEVNGINKVLAENLSYQLSKKDTPLN